MTIHIPVFLRPHPLFSQTSTTSRAIPHKRPALTALYKPVQETAHSRARECAVVKTYGAYGDWVLSVKE